MGHFFSGEFGGGGREAADGWSEWIVRVRNGATSPGGVTACGVSSRGGRLGRREERKRHDEDEWRKWVQVVKRERRCSCWKGGGEGGGGGGGGRNKELMEGRGGGGGGVMGVGSGWWYGGGGLE